MSILILEIGSCGGAAVLGSGLQTAMARLLLDRRCSLRASRPLRYKISVERDRKNRPIRNRVRYNNKIRENLISAVTSIWMLLAVLLDGNSLQCRSFKQYLV